MKMCVVFFNIPARNDVKYNRQIFHVARGCRVGTFITGIQVVTATLIDHLLMICHIVTRYGSTYLLQHILVTLYDTSLLRCTVNIHGHSKKSCIMEGVSK